MLNGIFDFISNVSKSEIFNGLSVMITVGDCFKSILLFILGYFFKKIIYFISLIKIKFSKEELKNQAIVIITTCKNDDIQNTVNDYIKNNKKLKNIKTREIIYLSKSNKIQKKDIYNISENLKTKINLLGTVGIVKYHIFMKCPIVIGAMVGSEFANRGKVYLYHKNSGSSKYEFWGHLNK